MSFVNGTFNELIFPGFDKNLLTLHDLKFYCSLNRVITLIYNSTQTNLQASAHYY